MGIRTKFSLPLSFFDCTYVYIFKLVSLKELAPMRRAPGRVPWLYGFLHSSDGLSGFVCVSHGRNADCVASVYTIAKQVSLRDQNAQDKRDRL